MSETHDPWKDVTPRVFTASDGKTEIAFYPAKWVDAARAAEATQHQQEIAEVVEAHATERDLAIANVAIAKDAEVATLRAELDRLKAAAQAVLDNNTCADPDCCTTAMKHEAARQTLRAALSGEGTAKP